MRGTHLLILTAFSVLCSVDGAVAAGESSGGVAQKTAAKPKKPVKLKIGRAYKVVTKQAKVYSGVLTKKDVKSITLKLTTGRSVRILRKDIETVREVEVPVARRPTTNRKQSPTRGVAVQQQRMIVRRAGRSQYTADVRDKVDRDDPTERVLVLSPKGPVIVELDIFLNGRPFRHAREAIVDEMFHLADTNDDGKRTWNELLQNPRLPSRRYQYNSNNKRIRENYIKQLDVNGDGIPDRREIRRMAARIGYGAAFHVQPLAARVQQPDAQSLLDANKNGRLSKDELAAASARLKSRDANDNDLLEISELGGGRRGRLQRGVRLRSRQQEVHLLGPAADLTTIHGHLQKRYADDKDEKKGIRASAVPLDRSLFKKLDLNKNGLLEAGELVGLHLAEPHIKLVVHITGGFADDEDTKAKNDKPRDRTSGVVVKKVPAGFEISPPDAGTPVNSCTVALPGWKLRIGVQPFPANRLNYSRYAQSYMARYDADKNGYLNAKDIKELGRLGRSLNRQLPQWDQNGDGKVFEKEILSYYKRSAAPRLSQVMLVETSQGPSLFAALDISGDNRLSLREMKTAGDRLLMLDRNDNGRIDADEMPGETVMTFTQGGYNRSLRYGRGSSSRFASQARGPKWFIHMDTNGDGDVTLKEFLGTKQQFDMLDTNDDGFIEPKEAVGAGLRADPAARSAPVSASKP